MTTTEPTFEDLAAQLVAQFEQLGALFARQQAEQSANIAELHDVIGELRDDLHMTTARLDRHTRDAALDKVAGELNALDPAVLDAIMPERAANLEPVYLDRCTYRDGLDRRCDHARVPPSTRCAVHAGGGGASPIRRGI